MKQRVEMDELLEVSAVQRSQSMKGVQKNGFFTVKKCSLNQFSKSVSCSIG